MARSSGVLAVLSVAALLLAGCNGISDGPAGAITEHERDGKRILTESRAPDAMMQALIFGTLAVNEEGCYGLGTDGIIFPHGTKLTDEGISRNGVTIRVGDDMSVGGGGVSWDPGTPERDLLDACGFTDGVFLGQGDITLGADIPGASEPELTGEAIATWVTNTDWLFSPEGLQEPFTLTLVDGEASDDLGRTYELGEFVESDANGDGIIDIAIPITEFDGNGVTTLWYVWLGQTDGPETRAFATQMVYPIARMTRCGDAIHEVTATDHGFAVEETLRHPLDPGDCATGGTWHQTRELEVHDIAGEHFPILLSPVHAWGGVCPVPTLDWLDGEMMTGVEVRSAPHSDASVIFTEEESWGIFGLPEAPLMAASGASFFGFMPNEYTSQAPDEIEHTPVRTHCAFAGGAE